MADKQRRFDYLLASTLAVSILGFTRVVPEAFDLPKAVVAIVTGPTLLFAALLTNKRLPTLRREPFAALLALAMIGFVVSFAVAPNKALALIGQEQRFTGLVVWLSSLVGCLAAFIGGGPRTAERVLRGLVWTGVPFLFYGFLQAIESDPFSWTVTSFTSTTVFSTQGNPNFASWTCSLIIGASSYFVIDPPRRFDRLMGSSMAASCLWLLVETNSVQGVAGVGVFGLCLILISTSPAAQSHRSSLLSTGLVLLSGAVLVFAWANSTDRAILVAGVVLIGLSMVGKYKGDVNVRVLRRALSVASISAAVVVAISSGWLLRELEKQSGERTAFYQAGLRMFSDHPMFGIGLERYGRLFAEYRPLWHAERLEGSLSSSPHSIWLGFAVWGGVVLLLPMLGILFQLAVHLIRVSRQSNASRAHLHLCLVAVVSAAAWIISAESASVIFVTSVLIGMAMSTQLSRAKSSSLHARRLLLATVALLVMITSLLSIRWMAGNRAQNDAYRELFGNQNIEKGLDLLDKAVEWGPVPNQARALRGNVYAQLGLEETAVSDALATLRDYEYSGPGSLSAAKILIQFGRVAEASDALGEIVARNPGSAGLVSEAETLLQSLDPGASP